MNSGRGGDTNIQFLTVVLEYSPHFSSKSYVNFTLNLSNSRILTLFAVISAGFYYLPANYHHSLRTGPSASALSIVHRIL